MDSKKAVFIGIFVVISIFVSVHFINKLYKSNVPSNEYEELAYGAFMNRFGHIENITVTKVSSCVTTYENIENNLYCTYDEEYSQVDKNEYRQFIDVNIEFLIDKDTGNLSKGKNDFSYYLGLNKNGEYVLLGETLLG